MVYFPPPFLTSLLDRFRKGKFVGQELELAEPAQDATKPPSITMNDSSALSSSTDLPIDPEPKTTIEEKKLSGFPAVFEEIDKGNFQGAYDLFQKDCQTGNLEKDIENKAFILAQLFKGGWAEGFSILKDLADENENNLEVLFWLGSAYGTSHMWELAISYIKKWKESSGQNLTNQEKSSRISTYAGFLLISGQEEKAQKELKNGILSISDPPEQSNLYNALGKMLLKTHPSEPTIAFACFEKAIELQPGNTFLRFNFVYGNSNTIEQEIVFHHYKKHINIKPEPWALNNFGVSADNLGFKFTAISSYKIAAKKDYSLAMANLANTYIFAGFEEEAKNILSEAREKEDVHPNVNKLLGTIENKMKVEEDKIILNEAKADKLISWRRREAEAFIKPELTSVPSQISYFQNDGSQLLLSTDLNKGEITGVMTTAQEEWTFQGRIYGQVFKLTWETKPIKNEMGGAALLTSPLKRFSLLNSPPTPRSGKCTLIVTEEGAVLKGYRANDSDLLDITEMNLTRNNPQQNLLEEK